MVDTSSTFLLSGNAVDTTYSTNAYLCSLLGSNAADHNSFDYLLTKYYAYNLYKLFLLVNSNIS